MSNVDVFVYVYVWMLSLSCLQLTVDLICVYDKIIECK